MTRMTMRILSLPNPPPHRVMMQAITGMKLRSMCSDLISSSLIVAVKAMIKRVRAGNSTPMVMAIE